MASQNEPEIQPSAGNYFIQRNKVPWFLRRFFKKLNMFLVQIQYNVTLSSCYSRINVLYIHHSECELKELMIR